MMHEVRFYRLDYQKGKVPGMGYKKTRLGRTWFSDLRRATIGTEAAIWQCAARLRITGSVDTFAVREYGDNADWFCGSL
jgi:hypothetical protein